MDAELASGHCRAQGVEQRHLEEDVDRRLGAAGRLAADHAAQALRTGGVGDHRHLAVERVFTAIQRLQRRSEEHTSELQSLMRISSAVFCLKKKKKNI